VLDGRATINVTSDHRGRAVLTGARLSYVGPEALALRKDEAIESFFMRQNNIDK